MQKSGEFTEAQSPAERSENPVANNEIFASKSSVDCQLTSAAGAPAALECGSSEAEGTAVVQVSVDEPVTKSIDDLGTDSPAQPHLSCYPGTVFGLRRKSHENSKKLGTLVRRGSNTLLAASDVTALPVDSLRT